MTESREKVEEEAFKRVVEKHCNIHDAPNAFIRDLCEELGAHAEAVLSRLWEKHYSNKTERKLFIRKWDNVTLRAKDRAIGKIKTVSSETTYR